MIINWLETQIRQRYIMQYSPIAFSVLQVVAFQVLFSYLIMHFQSPYHAACPAYVTMHDFIALVTASHLYK
jgi:hypothetical protein